MIIIDVDGNLGRPAELKHLDSGQSVCNLAMAGQSGFGDNKKTMWFSVAIWGKRGETVHPYLLKGTKVRVVGELSIREWTTQEGVVKQVHEINCYNISLLSKAPQEAAPPPRPVQPAPAPAQTASPFTEDDDVPF